MRRELTETVAAFRMDFVGEALLDGKAVKIRPLRKLLHQPWLELREFKFVTAFSFLFSVFKVKKGPLPSPLTVLRRMDIVRN